MSLITDLARDSITTLRDEGVGPFVSKANNFLKLYGATHLKKKITTSINGQTFKDVLFINGCDESVPHPARYRVTHQREQLEAQRVSTDQVYYLQLELDMVRYYRTFIFFRCPYTDTIGRFIEIAKELNKHVLFDIDDLVIDTKYTDTNVFVQALKGRDKEIYDDGVNRMGKTLRLCDAAITTTERLAAELNKYVPEVYINRNTASEAMLLYSDEARKEKKQGNNVKIGYFSGSYSHSADFDLIKPVLIKLLQNYSNLELHLVGEINLPEDLKTFEKQIVIHPFVDWKKLPSLIAGVDINLAPLTEGAFNEAKSENKWVEAALVEVPTVASKVGAFDRMIDDGNTGLLCADESDWETALRELIEHPQRRLEIAGNAYRYCKEHCTTLKNGYGLYQFLKRYMTPNIGFVVPPMTISGGIRVILKHAVILRNAGYDVFLLEMDGKRKWIEYEGRTFPVIGRDLSLLAGRIDKIVATMWSTVTDIEHNPNVGERFYLVQGYEVGFYQHNDPRYKEAYASYHPIVPVEMITISKWCQGWITNEMHHSCKYAPNGIDQSLFPSRKRSFTEKKIRILIEGNCGVESKNVDESFLITNKLPREKYEIWYLSYNAKPKSWYKIDKFLNKVPYEEVGKIYYDCDILLKTSILESFSYPPLEMMATGGFVVAVLNDGNSEYLIHEKNCLVYPQGNIDEGIKAIERICSDSALRDILEEGGKEIVTQRLWDNCQKHILDLYGGNTEKQA